MQIKTRRLARKLINEFKPVTGQGYKSSLRQLFEILQLLLRCQLTPEEYYFYEFHKSGIDYKHMLNYISNYQKKHYFRPALNNHEWGEVFQNKFMFNEYMKKMSFPVTNIHGVYDQNSEHVKSGMLLTNPEELKGFFLQNKPETLVIKPVCGCEGKGVLVFKELIYLNDEIIGITGVSQKYSFGDIVNHLHQKVPGIVNLGYIMEEKLNQHELINQLNPSSLNTLRVLTLLEKQGTVNFHTATIRLGRAGSFLNNASRGGLLVYIDPETGIIGKGLIGKGFGSGFYDEHPDSKIKFVGMKIPFWEEVIRLCSEAAKCFPYCRDLGWDIAITPDGPVFVEGSHVHDIVIQVVTNGFLQPGVRKSLDELGLAFPDNKLPGVNFKKTLQAIQYWSGK